MPLLIETKDHHSLCKAGQILVSAQRTIICYLLSQHTHKQILDMFNLPKSMMPFIDWENIKILKTNMIGRFEIHSMINGYQFCEVMQIQHLVV